MKKQNTDTPWESLRLPALFLLTALFGGIAGAQPCIQEPLAAAGSARESHVVAVPAVRSITPLGVRSSEGWDDLASFGIIEIDGLGLAAESGTLTQAAAGELPLRLGGTEVLLGKQPIPLLTVTDTMIVAQLPPTLTGSTLLVNLHRRDGSVCAGESAPLIVYPAAITLARKPDGTPAVQPFGNSKYVVYLYGMGDVIGGMMAGKPASAAKATLYPATVRINGREAAVEYYGVSPGSVGLYQVNFELPRGVDRRSGPPIIALTQFGRTVTFALP